MDIASGIDEAIRRLIEVISDDCTSPDDVSKYASAIDKLTSARATERGYAGTGGNGFQEQLLEHLRRNEESKTQSEND